MSPTRHRDAAHLPADARLRAGCVRALFCLSVAFAWAFPASAAERPIVVGVEVDNPPLEFLDDRGAPTGFDVDLVRAVAAAMKMDVTFRAAPWDRLREQLQRGEIDALAGMYYSPERLQDVEFSLPHTVLTYSIFVRDGSREAPQLVDLAGRQVLVGRGEIMEEYLRGTGLPIRLEPVESASVALGFLASGRGDAAAAPLLYGNYLAHRFHLTNIRPTGTPLHSYDLCFAVKKGNRRLDARLDEGLNLIRADGTYRQIYVRWFGVVEPGTGLPWSKVVRWGIAILGPLVLLLALAGAWSWTLRRQVRRQTEDLSRELDQRRRAEAALHYRLAGEEIVTTISTRFVRGRLEDFAALIEQSIGDLARWIGADVARLLLVEREATLVEHGRWVLPGVTWKPPLGAAIPLGAFPHAVFQLGQGEVLHFRGLDDLPADAEPERRLWVSSGVGSLVAVPLLRGGELTGCLELISLQQPIVLKDDDKWLLRLGTEVLLSANELLAAATGLAREKERLAVTLRSLGEGVLAADIDGRIVLVNPAAEKITGWSQEQAGGRLLTDVLPLDESVLRTGPVATESGSAHDLHFVRRDGGKRVVEYTASPIADRSGRVFGNVVVVRDVTLRRRLESDLQRTAKLEALGVLAGGIAHDFNNILTGILGSLSCARMLQGEDAPGSDLLLEAEKASLRAAGLTQQLLTLAKGGAPIKAAASLGEIVTDSVHFALRGSGSRPVLDLAADLWPATVDAIQFSQVIQNLVINAAQAMPDGGTVTVRASNVEYDGRGPWPLPAGDLVMVTVTDEGSGIAPELLDRIFDPFFTTKAKGSGLGLTTAHSIMNRHGGYLGVSSSLGRGTTFTLLLPATKGGQVATAQEEPAPAAHQGRVLVMDDEAAVLVAARALFGSVGFEVATAANALEAERLFREAVEAHRPFTLVVLDLTVPGGTGGEECIRALRAIDPGVVAIVSSGYSNDPVMADFARHGFREILPKPYRAEDIRALLARLQASVDAPPETV